MEFTVILFDLILAVPLFFLLNWFEQKKEWNVFRNQFSSYWLFFNLFGSRYWYVRTFRTFLFYPKYFLGCLF